MDQALVDGNKALWDEALSRVEKPTGCSFCDMSSSALTIVLVEFRDLPFYLERVLWNVAWAYKSWPDVALRVVCGRSNERRVRHILEADLPGAEAVVLPHDNIDIAGYNALLTSTAFYDLFSTAPYILVIQTDTLTRKPIPRRLLGRFSYVGAPWFGPQINGPAFCVVGNGGYSLRHVRTMRDACRRVRFDTSKDTNEDLFFAKHAVSPDLVIATKDEACRFSVEHVHHPDPCGLHQTWRFHATSAISRLLQGLPGHPDYPEPLKGGKPRPSLL